MGIEINGIMLDFNIFDADFADDYENALKVVQDFKPTGKTLGAVIREQCECVNEFFDSVFGEGTALAIFNGKCDLEASLEAFGRIVQAGESQKNRLNEKVANIKNHSVPVPQNREQRRSMQKQGNVVRFTPAVTD